jgi:hypothetical protein
MNKYHVTVRATTNEGRKERTFIIESDKESENLQKEIEQEYDMLRNVQVSIKLL